MNYQQARDFLDQLQFFKIKLGLDSMTRFLNRLGNPQQHLHCIHIGGTNGKGSVGATLCSILSAADYKAGFYTSPHLSSVRERFRIGNTYISKEDFARLMSKIEQVLDGNQITYFECTTTLALLWFAEQEVDCVLLEVGMGGRLDATNVITPLVSIITNVSMDHELYLGATLAQVAGEKAGIIKKQIPLVSAVADDDSGEVIRQTCEERNAPLFLFGQAFRGRVGEDASRWQYQGLDGQLLNDLPMAMKGNYQIGNASLALATVQLLNRQGWSINEEHIRTGLAQTRWPGRLEYFRRKQEGREDCPEGLRFLIDGAHNPAGVAALQQALKDFSFRQLILVWGAMVDKDLGTTLQTIAPMAGTIIFTRPESERSASPEQLQAALPPTLEPKIILTGSVQAALEQACALAAADDLICIAGSLFLVGAARQLLLGDLVNE